MMLSKLTLNFLYPGQQEKYMQRNSEKIIKEHLNFTLYALAFAIINMVQFIIQQSVAYSILAASSCILIIILYKFIVLKPQYINYVLTFYQFYVLLIIEINELLSSEEKASGTFAWSYGYQAGCMHFTLYIQGTNLVASTLVLMIVTFTHLSLFIYDPLYTYTNIFSFIFLFICQIGVKYIIVKEERRKSSFIFINKNNGNKQSENRSQIRCYQSDSIRNRTNQDQSSKLVDVAPGQSFNLEQMVRGNFVKTSEKSDFRAKKHFIDQLNRDIYKVKMNKFILNNELQCLLILDKIQMPNNKFQDIQIKLFSELSMSVTSQMQLVLKSLGQLPAQFIRENYFIQTTLFYIQVLTSNLQQIKKEDINQLRLTQTLRQIFGKICSVNSPFTFQHEYKYIISIIVCCAQLIQYTNQEILPHFRVLFKKNVDSQIQMTISYSYSRQDSYKYILNLLMANWVGQNKKFTQQQLYQNCMDRLYFLALQYHMPVLLLFNICIMQIIMSQICTFNHFKIENKNQCLELTCTFQY